MNTGAAWKVAAMMLFAGLLVVGSVAFVIHDRDAARLIQAQQALASEWNANHTGTDKTIPIVTPFASGDALLVINSHGTGVVVFPSGRFSYVANTDNYQDPSSKTQTASGPNFRTSLEEPFVLTKIQTASEVAADRKADLTNRVNRAVDEAFKKDEVSVPAK